jgi:hypothetical protein
MLYLMQVFAFRKPTKFLPSHTGLRYMKTLIGMGTVT